MLWVNKWRKPVAFPLVLILSALLVNQWTLGYILTTDGQIDDTLFLVLIWLFDIYAVLLAVWAYTRRNHLGRIHIRLVVMIAVVEVGLHVMFAVFNLMTQNNGTVDERVLLSPYQDKEWAVDLFKEYHQVPGEYDQFLAFRGKEYHGKYINIDEYGFRKTWNPEDFDGNSPGTIYVFGGSTIWGVGARDNYTIPSYMSKELYARGYSFVVENRGEQAYVFTQEVMRLVLLLRDGYRPDYVVFYDGANDVRTAYDYGVAGRIWWYPKFRERLLGGEPSNRDHFLIGIRGLINDNILSIKAIVQLVEHVNQGSKDGGEANRPYSEEQLMRLAQDIVENYVKSVKFLDHLSKAYGFKYICFWQPTVFTEKHLTEEEARFRTEWDVAMGQLYRMTLELLMNEQIPHFYVLSDALDGRTGIYYIDAAHLSEEGNAVVARRIVDVFEQEFLLKR